MVDPDRFRSDREIYGGCGGRLAGAYVLDGVLAGPVGLCGLDVAPFNGVGLGENNNGVSLPRYESALPLCTRLLPFEPRLFIGTLVSRGAGIGGFATLTPLSASSESWEPPEDPESLVCTWGRSMTLGDLRIPRISPSSACEKRTDRGDTSTLMADGYTLRLPPVVSSSFAFSVPKSILARRIWDRTLFILGPENWRGRIATTQTLGRWRFSNIKVAKFSRASDGCSRVEKKLMELGTPEPVPTPNKESLDLKWHGSLAFPLVATVCNQQSCSTYIYLSKAASLNFSLPRFISRNRARCRVLLRSFYLGSAFVRVLRPSCTQKTRPYLPLLCVGRT